MIDRNIDRTDRRTYAIRVERVAACAYLFTSRVKRIRKYVGLYKIKRIAYCQIAELHSAPAAKVAAL
jgi:ribosomal protein L37E